MLVAYPIFKMHGLLLNEQLDTCDAVASSRVERPGCSHARPSQMAVVVQVADVDSEAIFTLRDHPLDRPLPNPPSIMPRCVCEIICSTALPLVFPCGQCGLAMASCGSPNRCYSPDAPHRMSGAPMGVPCQSSEHLWKSPSPNALACETLSLCDYSQSNRCAPYACPRNSVPRCARAYFQGRQRAVHEELSCSVSDLTGIAR